MGRGGQSCALRCSCLGVRFIPLFKSRFMKEALEAHEVFFFVVKVS